MCTITALPAASSQLVLERTAIALRQQTNDFERKTHDLVSSRCHRLEEAVQRFIGTYLPIPVWVQGVVLARVIPLLKRGRESGFAFSASFHSLSCASQTRTGGYVLFLSFLPRSLPSLLFIRRPLHKYTAMSRANEVFSGFSIVTFFLVVIPLPWHLEGAQIQYLVVESSHVLTRRSMEYGDCALHRMDFAIPSDLLHQLSGMEWEHRECRSCLV